MQKIMFNDRFLLTQAVLEGRKTQTTNKSVEFMKELKRLNVTVTYSVELSDVSLPDGVYNDLIALYDSGVNEIEPDADNDMEMNVCDWLADHIKESDCYTVSYEIDDIEE